MKRILISLSASAFVCAMAWLGGFDFDTRGNTAMLVFFASVASSFFVYLLAGEFQQ